MCVSRRHEEVVGQQVESSKKKKDLTQRTRRSQEDGWLVGGEERRVPLWELLVQGLRHFEGDVGGNDAAAHGEDVGFVVFAGEARGHYVMGQSGANAGDFVGGDGNADA
jgi:hypothetical protein